MLFGLDINTLIMCNIKILLTLKKSWPGRDDMHPIEVKAFQIICRISAILYGSYFPMTIFLSITNPVKEIPIDECAINLMAGILYLFFTLHI